eukprot:528088_1
MSALSQIDSIINKFNITSNKPMENDQKSDEVIDRESITISCQQRQVPGWSYSFDITNILYSKKSKFQDIKIVESPIFNRCLIMDGQIQSSVRDEFIYHESLVHPAMMSHPNPQTIFIGGGGECATAREVLKYSSVQKLIICDIDPDIINVSKKYLPSMYGVKDNDKRCEIVIQDAKKYIEEFKGEFDVIIMDICDPIEAGPGIVCYFKEFYEMCKRKLSKNGILVTQSTASSLLLYHECFTVIVNTLKSVFDDVMGYNAYVPTFYAEWGYTLAFKGKRPDWFMNVKYIDGVLEKKLGKNGVDKLRYYDGVSHLRMFNLPKYLRVALDKEKRVMTKDTPYYQVE